MPLIPFPVNEFGGWNPTVDPTDVGTGAATDLLNVDLARPGLLKTRDGTTSVTALASVTSANGLAGYKTTSVVEVVLGYFDGVNHNFKAYQATAGTLIATAASHPAASSFTAVQFGTPSAASLYMANGSDTIWKWSGAAFSQPAGMPIAAHVAVTAASNRLAAANIVGTSGSRVSFSDVGAPETWTSTSFVDLTPGDGSDINALAAWHGNVYAFKRSKFFVFTGESTLSDGSPVFNYRQINGYGSTGRVAVSGRGIYFFDGRNLWHYSGGDVPERISGPVDEFFAGRATINGNTFTVGGTIDRMFCARGQVFVPISSTLTLVYDENTAQWTAFDLDMRCSAPVYLGDTVYPYIATTARLAYISPAATTDAGSAIAWSYTTGYSSAGGYFRQRIVSSGERKKHFQTDILGSGTVTHQVLALNARPNDVADPGGSVTLGTSPAIARGSRRRGVRGTYFAHKLSGSGPAVVSGLTYWISEVSLDT